MRSELRAAVVVTLSIAAFAIVGPGLFSRFTTAYTGAHFSGITVTAVDAGSPAEHAGLHRGDRIGCIDTRDYMMLAAPFTQRKYEPDTMHFCVTNGATRRAVAFAAIPGSQSVPFYGNTAMQVLRLISYATFLFVGCALVMLRPSLMTWLLFCYCLSQAPVAAAYQTLTVWPPLPFAVLIAVFSPSAALGSVFLFLFALLVPEQRIPAGWRAWLFWSMVAGAGAFMVAHTIYRMAFPGFFSPLDPAQITLSRVMTILVLFTIAARLLNMEPVARARFRWVAAAIVVGIVLNELRQGAEAFWPGVFGTLTMFMPLTLMYAIVRRHVIDIRFVISKAVVYGGLMTAIFGTIAAADWAATRFLAEMRVALALDAVIAISIGVLMHRLTPGLEAWVDSIIYRRKHAAETYIKRLARTLPRAEREETIDRALVEDPYSELDLTMAALFRKHANGYALELYTGESGMSPVALERDDDLIRFLLAERSCIYISDLNGRVAATLHDGSAAIAIPIFNGDELAGFTLYGVHRDGTRLDPDEAALLESLADAAGQAYVRVENSRLRALVVSPAL